MAENKRKYNRKPKVETPEKESPQSFTLLSSIPYLHVEGFTFKGNRLEVGSREIVERLLKYSQITEEGGAE